MLAALSPADINYDETYRCVRVCVFVCVCVCLFMLACVSTLLYANRAKNIKNVSKKNEVGA